MKHLQTITKKAPRSSSPQEASKLIWCEPAYDGVCLSIDCQDGKLGLRSTGGLAGIDEFKPFLK